jgi:8-oxo-dGTP pyrophosphatase MutT (NUDIX family)
LARCRRYLLDTTMLEFPIGGVAVGETPLSVAVRETREEVGFQPRQMTPLGRFAPYKGVSNEVCHFFLGEDLVACGQRLEVSEEIAVELVPLAEVRELLLAEAVGDGQSLAGWLLLERYCRSEAGGRVANFLG